ncbi:unnamed protein product [Lupinus luteus]|uniref:Uncharacterized protein n=1 Tax=Lupinus luteus TaxID=3873 RepID=A0AAV1W9V1_LUPLU
MPPRDLDPYTYTRPPKDPRFPLVNEFDIPDSGFDSDFNLDIIYEGLIYSDDNEDIESLLEKSESSLEDDFHFMHEEEGLIYSDDGKIYERTSGDTIWVPRVRGEQRSVIDFSYYMLMPTPKGAIPHERVTTQIPHNFPSVAQMHVQLNL